jgi:hypothetical protein
MKRLPVLALSLLSACTGVFDSLGGPSDSEYPDPSQNGGANGDPNDPNNPGGTPFDPNDPNTPVDLGEARPPLCKADTRDKRGPRVLRRLTKDEFENTMRAVFGFDEATYRSSDLPPDSAAQNGMTNQADQLVVGEGVAERALASAEQVAELVISDAHLTRILPCASQGDDGCVETLFDTVGKRLYRRPLSEDERARYRDLRDTVADEGGDFREFVRWALVGMITSPHALYRSELGSDAGDGSYALSGYERATALAYTFTGSPPSDALLEAAGRGELDSKAGMESAAKDLVLDGSGNVRPQFAALFRRFISQWLGLSAFDNRDKDTSVFTDWSNDVRAAMREELDRFVDHVVFEEKGGIAELLTAPYTLLDARLAAFYRYGTAATDTYEITQRPEGWGVGLLAQGTILALKATNRDTSPTQRGHMIRDRIMCNEIPPPPPVVGDLPAPTEADTTRQRYEELHAADAACVGCHRAMDQIGFTFEGLDAVGRIRTQENGFDIDDSGIIVALRGGEEDVPVQGPTELASALADRETVGACFGAFYASFSFGFDQKDSACLVSTPREQLAAGDLSLLEFFTSITTAPHFTSRVDQ